MRSTPGCIDTGSNQCEHKPLPVVSVLILQAYEAVTGKRWEKRCSALSESSKVEMSRMTRGQKTGGRKVGTPGRNTRKINELLESLGHNPIAPRPRCA
jgi:hypothetical protein